MKLSAPLKYVLSLIGLTPQQIAAIFEKDDYLWPGGYWPEYSDGETWAEREKRIDDERFMGGG